MNKLVVLGLLRCLWYLKPLRSKLAQLTAWEVTSGDRVQALTQGSGQGAEAKKILP